MKKQKPKWIVTRAGRPCTLQYVPKLLGPKFCPKGGILLPSPFGEVTLFGGEKSALRAIGRAVKVRNTLAAAIFTLPPSYAPFVEAGNFQTQRQEIA